MLIIIIIRNGVVCISCLQRGAWFGLYSLTIEQHLIQFTEI